MSFTRAKKRGKSYKPFVPKDYQSVAIEFGVSRPSAGFFLAPGLGKTMILLMLFRILKRLGLVDEMLVIATRRIIYNVWRQEAKKWDKTHNLTFALVHGPDKEKALMSDSDIKLINYEAIEWLAQQNKYFKQKKRVMLALDESSKIKNSATVRFKRLKKILHFFTRRYIATGSPVATGLMGLFSQQYVLDLGETFGPFITKFRNDYFYPTGYMGYKYKLQRGARKRIYKRTKPYVIRFGSSRLNLPPVTFINREIELPEKTVKQYLSMEKTYVAKIKNHEITASNAATRTGKLRQMANGSLYTGEADKAFTIAHEEKCADLVELLDELNGEPALIGYEFHHDRELLKQYFKRHAPQYADAPFTSGKTKEKEFNKIIQQWQDGELPALFAQIHNAAHGLNLQGQGGIVIYYSQVWSPEAYDQFFRRVYRQGQTRRVLVYRLISKGTVDEDVVSSLAQSNKSENHFLKAMERRHAIH